MNNPARKSSEHVRTVAVIDVGTTSVRMAIAEIFPDGDVRLLESLSQAVTLGKDTFTRGEIARNTIEECVAALKAYRRKLNEYQITRAEDIRVVATSAVREATNRIMFADRMFVATGLSVETLDAAEVHRITFRGVQPMLKGQVDLFQSQSFVTEVGGGSTELLLLKQGDVAYSHGFRLGSLRLLESLSKYHFPREKRRQIMQTEILSQLEPLTELVESDNPTSMVAMGGDIRFAVAQLLKTTVGDDELVELPVSQLATFTDQILSMSDEALVSKYQLTFPEAETLGSALLINLTMAQLLGVDQILVSSVNLRDGLLNDMSKGPEWSEDFQQQIIRSAWELAKKYDVDDDHAHCVGDLARQLFRQLQAEHDLDSRYELLLYVAALLHETGAYINTSSIHKHSMYLIMNSSLFGLTSEDLTLVSLVARYHRRALPRSSHQQYASMDRYRRVAISKLAAILRLAIAMDASRTQRVKEIECTRTRNRLVISVPNIDDLSVEQIAMRRNRQFFESIFGLDVLLRTQVKELKIEPSAQL
ncbi:Ppx/GppA phosphatase family protein [Thalassoglobus polymorphus]|uniref:Exopolyphosphatase n=1 Tax=Thalassoglobus polymorphus TaxID=2527994 RepID=A0A517QI47_9PLAN|nr:Ppx/GppA phosphatase family protein [Thalassoglobus polymorphus]QDT31237.1 Exopolyphosphatase [Thalassoglobus polymorphus]